MGLGGYLAARGDAEHYENERRREEREVVELPDVEAAETAEIFRSYGLTDAEIEPITRGLRARPGAWVDFMMRFELGLEKPDPKRALTSALTIAGSYIAGGLIPLAPYMLLVRPHEGLLASILLTFAALVVFGYVKGRFTGARPARSAFHTALVGGL